MIEVRRQEALLYVCRAIPGPAHHDILSSCRNRGRDLHWAKPRERTATRVANAALSLELAQRGQCRIVPTIAYRRNVVPRSAGLEVRHAGCYGRVKNLAKPRDQVTNARGIVRTELGSFANEHH